MHLRNRYIIGVGYRFSSDKQTYLFKQMLKLLVAAAAIVPITNVMETVGGLLAGMAVMTV